MNKVDRQLMIQLANYDNYENNNVVGGGSSEIGAKVAPFPGNPYHKAQFSLALTSVFFNETVPAVILPAALAAVLQVSNPIYIFGNSDFSGSYQKARQLVPFVVGGAGLWNFRELGVLGRDTFTTDIAAAAPAAVDGDMIFVSEATIAAVVTLRVAVVHCPEVAYATLLDSIQSDRFILNMIRYVVDPTLTAQLALQISVMRQSLFGKTSDDAIAPLTYITGQTFNRNIADMPLEIGVDKNLILGVQMLFNVQLIDWIITVLSVKKVTEPIYN